MFPTTPLDTRDPHREPRRHRSRGVRVAGLVVLAVVLALAFMGHLSADMKLQWENLMTLCGF